MSSVGIVIPALNPRCKRLLEYIEDINSQINPDEMIVELDATDNKVYKMLDGAKVRVNTSNFRRGKGLSITSGFEKLNTDILSFVDSDGSTSVSSLQDIIQNVERNSTMCIGSRNLDKSKITEPRPYHRRLLSDVFNHLASSILCTQISDYQCGAKAITREIWIDVRNEITTRGFGWDIDLISSVARNEYMIEELSVEWEHKKGTSVTKSAPFNIFKSVLEARFKTLEKSSEKSLVDIVNNSE